MIQIENLDEVLKTLTDSINRVQKAVEGIPTNLKLDYLTSVPNLMGKNANEIVFVGDGSFDPSSIAVSNVSEVVKENKKYIEMSFYNTNEKATYIEFGTGRVGEKSPHPNQQAFQFNGLSGMNSWQYYVHTEFKKKFMGEEGWWHQGKFRTGIPSQPFIFTTLHQVSEKLPKDVKKAFKKGLEVK